MTATGSRCQVSSPASHAAEKTPARALGAWATVFAGLWLKHGQNRHGCMSWVPRGVISLEHRQGPTALAERTLLFLASCQSRSKPDITTMHEPSISARLGTSPHAKKPMIKAQTRVK